MGQIHIKEEVYKAPIDKVWQAITGKDQMREWYFDISDFELKEEAVFNFYEPGGKNEYHHRCTILQIVPLQKFQHTWEHPSHSKGVSVLTWELFAEGDKIRVKLSHEGIGNLQDGGPAFNMENYEAGWKEILGNSLKNFLDK